MLFKNSESRLCVFCRLNHRVYLKKEVSLFDGLLLLLITGILAYAIWGGPDLRSLLIFFSMAFAFQVFLRVRYRESLKCPHCGFDPILYKNDSAKAAEKVSGFLESRKNNPQYLLKPKPQITPRFVSRDEMRSKKLQLSEESLSNGELQSTEEEAINRESFPLNSF